MLARSFSLYSYVLFSCGCVSYSIYSPWVVAHPLSSLFMNGIMSLTSALHLYSLPFPLISVPTHHHVFPSHIFPTQSHTLIHKSLALIHFLLILHASLPIHSFLLPPATILHIIPPLSLSFLTLTLPPLSRPYTQPSVIRYSVCWPI